MKLILLMFNCIELPFLVIYNWPFNKDQIADYFGILILCANLLMIVSFLFSEYNFMSATADPWQFVSGGSWPGPPENTAVLNPLIRYPFHVILFLFALYMVLMNQKNKKLLGFFLVPLILSVTVPFVFHTFIPGPVDSG